MSKIKRQRLFSPLSPNFVYSVIINQAPDVTVFWAQADKKNLWTNYSGEKKRKKRGAGEEDLTEIERKVDFEDKRVSMGLCPCASVCDRQLYSWNAPWLRDMAAAL